MKNRLRPCMHHTDVGHELFFRCISHPGSGFAFECDATGYLDESKLTPIQAASLAIARSGDHREPELRVIEHNWFDPGSVRCVCGVEHNLQRGDSVCQDCGQWFNAVGQELLPPCQWED